MTTASPQFRTASRDGGPDRLLTPNEAAQLLRVSLSWLAKARLTGEGPRYVKIGRSVRYPESYLREYIRSRTR
jgi:predicted DNA-binding transcriptional regulator AlpA